MCRRAGASPWNCRRQRAPIAPQRLTRRRISTRWWMRRWRSGGSRRCSFGQEGGRFAPCCTAIRVDRPRLISTLIGHRQLRDQHDGGGPVRVEYTFFFHVGRRYGGGGMEHSNSTAIAVDSGADAGQRQRARVFSLVEREAHPAAVARAGGPHAGDVDAGAVVCRGRDQYLRLVHAGSQRAVEQGGISRRPGR